MKSYDLIVILGNGLLHGEYIPKHVKKRLRIAYDFYQKGAAPMIALVGKWSFQWDKQHITPQKTEAEAMREYLLQLGAPPTILLKEEESKDTISNAYYLKTTIVKPKKYKSMLVFVGDFLEKRSKFVFGKVFGKEYIIDFHKVATPFGSERKVEEEQDKIFSKQKILLQDMKDGDETFVKPLFFDAPYYQEPSDQLSLTLAEGIDVE